MKASVQNYKSIDDLDLFDVERDRRFVHRYATDAEISCRLVGHKPVSAILTNISTAGCEIRGLLGPVPDGNVWILLPGLANKFATIRWILSGGCGCEFVENLHPAVLDHVISSLPINPADNERDSEF